MRAAAIALASFINISSAWTAVSQIKPDPLLCAPPIKAAQEAFDINAMYRLPSQRLEFPLLWRGTVGVAGFAVAGLCGDDHANSRHVAHHQYTVEVKLGIPVLCGLEVHPHGLGQYLNRLGDGIYID